MESSFKTMPEVSLFPHTLSSTVHYVGSPLHSNGHEFKCVWVGKHAKACSVDGLVGMFKIIHVIVDILSLYIILLCVGLHYILYYCVLVGGSTNMAP